MFLNPVNVTKETLTKSLAGSKNIPKKGSPEYGTKMHLMVRLQF